MTFAQHSLLSAVSAVGVAVVVVITVVVVVIVVVAAVVENVATDIRRRMQGQCVLTVASAALNSRAL